MKFSTRTTYGLKAVLFLAGRYAEGSVSASQIAKKENISPAYLEQILHVLKKKGLVKTLRGPQGGYVLAKKPSEISLETLFYTLTPKAFAGISPTLATDTPSEAQVAELLFWKRFKASLDEGLQSTTLHDLIHETRKLIKSKGSQNITFHI